MNNLGSKYLVSNVYADAWSWDTSNSYARHLHAVCFRVDCGVRNGGILYVQPFYETRLH